MADRHVYSTLPLPAADPNEYDSIIAAWNSSSNGDAIYIHSGTYVGSGINSNITFSTKTGISIQNFENDPVTIDAQGTDSVVFAADTGMTIDGLHLKNPDFYCVRLDGADADGTVINNCTIEIGSAGVTGVHGNGAVNNVQVTNSTIYQYDDGTVPGNNTYLINALQAGAWLVEGNVLYSAEYHLGIGNGAVVTASRNYFDNTAGNDTWAINANATSPCVVKNNIFNGVGRALNNNVGNDGNIAFFNNHVISSSIGLWLQRYLSACKNNIFVGCTTAIQGDSGGDQPAPDYNCFFNNTNDVVNHVAATNSVTADPLIVDIGAENYTLDPELSPCINAGTDLSGDGVVVDYIGTTRPQNGAYDIGAYEKVGGSNPYKNGSLAYIFEGDVTKIISAGDIRKLLNN